LLPIVGWAVLLPLIAILGWGINVRTWFLKTEVAPPELPAA
jgi:hypothetical protein